MDTDETTLSSTNINKDQRPITPPPAIETKNGDDDNPNDNDNDDVVVMVGESLSPEESISFEKNSINESIEMDNNEQQQQQQKLINLNDQSSSSDQELSSSSTIILLKQKELEFEKKLDEMKQIYETKLKQQQLESTRKENILFMKLTLKEQELQDCLTQIDALKNLLSPTNPNFQLESYLLDPALNYLFNKMRKEVEKSRLQVEEMQNDMNAWKFNTDSITGKQLMAKCRQLHQENEDLGKMISSGKIAKLESGLAMHKNYSESFNKNQAEIEEVLNEMEENAEGFQNTVCYLQQQLKKSKEKNTKFLEIFQNCQCQCKEEFLEKKQDFEDFFENNNNNNNDNSINTTTTTNNNNNNTTAPTAMES